MEHAQVPESPRGRLWSRRRFLRTGAIGLGGGLALAALDEIVLMRLLQAASEQPATAAGPDPGLRFRSRRDLSPHPITVLTPARAAAPGYVFLTPAVDRGPSDGLVICDDQGEPVWIDPVAGRKTANLKVQEYQGSPVLTWWEGQVVQGHGRGEAVIADQTYRGLARIQAANGEAVDLHEFRLTSDGTALLTAYREVRQFTGPWGESVLEGIVQEIDVATRRLLFEWHSLGAVDLAESYITPPSDGTPYDYFHVNSVDRDHDGNLIVSARNTSTIYKLDRSSGEIIWRLGGKRSDFAVPSEAAFAWQHDALRQEDGTLTVFDDEAPPAPSRGLVLRLDEAGKTVQLVRAYGEASKISSNTRGDVQVLPNGNVMLGWGGAPYVSEYGPAGDLRFALALWPDIRSYRAFRFPWHASPSEAPAIAAERSPSGTRAYVSWNGATDVKSWQLLAGPGSAEMQSAGITPRSGFETTIDIASTASFVAAQALDAGGAVLGASAVVRVGA